MECPLELSMSNDRLIMSIFGMPGKGDNEKTRVLVHPGNTRISFSPLNLNILLFLLRKKYIFQLQCSGEEVVGSVKHTMGLYTDPEDYYICIYT